MQPQPAVYDPVLNKTFPLNVTDPVAIPAHNEDAVLFPPARLNLTDGQADAVIARASSNVLDIVANRTRAASSCEKCVAALQEGQTAARLAPERVPQAMVALCKATNFTSGCQAEYEAGSFGATWTQILAKADVVGLDGQFICAKLGSFCPAPRRTDTYAPVFPKPKPANATKPRPSGQKVKVLHLSDLHLDPRYEVGSEANCTANMCCRHDPPPANGTAAPVQLPAPLFGHYRCDSPYYLALAALQSIGPLTGTSKDEPPAFTLYTGDLVAHDKQNQRSRDYVQNIEASVWHMFKSYIGGPVYAALGVRLPGIPAWSREASEADRRCSRTTTPTRTTWTRPTASTTTDRWAGSSPGTTTTSPPSGSTTGGSTGRRRPRRRRTTPLTRSCTRWGCASSRSTRTCTTATTTLRCSTPATPTSAACSAS